MSNSAPILRTIGRIIVSLGLLIPAAFSIVFGCLFIRHEQVFFGVWFFIFGLLAMSGAVLYVWRGGNLGVKITGDNLVISHYFNARVVALASIKRMYRSVDATVLETEGGKVVFDDSLFSTVELRDSVLADLETYLKNRNPVL